VPAPSPLFGCRRRRPQQEAAGRNTHRRCVHHHQRTAAADSASLAVLVVRCQACLAHPAAVHGLPADPAGAAGMLMAQLRSGAGHVPLLRVLLSYPPNDLPEGVDCYAPRTPSGNDFLLVGSTAL